MMTGEAGTPVYMRYLLALGQKVSTTSNFVAGVAVVVVVVVDMVCRVRLTIGKVVQRFGS
jgi:hypothetical protein